MLPNQVPDNLIFFDHLALQQQLNAIVQVHIPPLPLALTGDMEAFFTSAWDRAIANSLIETPAPILPEIAAGANELALEAMGYTGGINENYICPISGVIITQPAYDINQLAGTRQYFEYAYLERALERVAENPLNRQPLTLETVAIDLEMKREIEGFVEWAGRQQEVNRALQVRRPLRLSQAPVVPQPVVPQAPVNNRQNCTIL